MKATASRNGMVIITISRKLNWSIFKKANLIRKHRENLLKYLSHSVPGTFYSIIDVLKSFKSLSPVRSLFSLQTCAPTARYQPLEFRVNFYSACSKWNLIPFAQARKQRGKSSSLRTPNLINSCVLLVYYLNIPCLCFTSLYPMMTARIPTTTAFHPNMLR